MSNDGWLLLTDYSSKYRISVSTLRRRIKADQIPFRFEGGKYFLLDRVLDQAPEPNPKTGIGTTSGVSSSKTKAADDSVTNRVAAEPAPLKKEQTSHSSVAPLTEDLTVDLDSRDEPLISTATKLLNELKRAYMNILQEKEEQIIQLKEEVSDLKTLVRVLEDDNERMRAILGIK